jgi:CPA2 family monovalent cation:H+ antiporter-2
MFFVSVGLLFDPRKMVDSPALTLVTLAIVMAGKPLAALGIVAILGYSSKVGLGVALALAQIGEFSFLLAALGRELGALHEEAMNALVAAAIFSILFNPMLYRCADPLERFLLRNPALWRMMNRRAKGESRTAPAPEGEPHAHRAVVVGYGPTGQLVSRILEERGIVTTIIEMNVETYRRLRNAGHRATYGDAAQAEVLEQAGVAEADGLILSAAGSGSVDEVVRLARRINPRIHVVARAEYVKQAGPLKKAGANEVFTGEGEVAVAMAGSILQELGATPAQLDEERERIRQALADGAG